MKEKWQKHVNENEYGSKTFPRKYTTKEDVGPETMYKNYNAKKKPDITGYPSWLSYPL